MHEENLPIRQVLKKTKMPFVYDISFCKANSTVIYENRRSLIIDFTGLRTPVRSLLK